MSSVQLGRFTGDYDELAQFVDREWGLAYEAEQRFAYTGDWLAHFFTGADPELLVESRDVDGSLAGFVAAVPRRVHVHGRETKVALATLLTTKHAPGASPRGFMLLRELFQRAQRQGFDATYHFCVSSHGTAELVIGAATRDRRRPIELAPVGSLLGIAAPASPGSVVSSAVRVLQPSDVSQVVALFEGLAGTFPVGRVTSAESLMSTLGTMHAHVLLRDDRVIGCCTWSRRRMLGKSITEIANIDLLVAPEATHAEATTFGKAIAQAAFERGAQMLVAPERPASVCPNAKQAGFRRGGRTLRTLVVPVSTPALTLAPGETHLLEIE